MWKIASQLTKTTTKILFLFLACTSSAEAASFRGLFNGRSGDIYFANGVSADGSTVVGSGLLN